MRELSPRKAEEFFLATRALPAGYVDALRSQLQGDITSSEMAIEKVKPDEVRITRARFPWVDARLTHRDDTVSLDYAKGPGTAGDPHQDRVTRSFAFQATPEDTLVLQDAFTSESHLFKKPEEFARHIAEILFRA